MFNIGDYLPVLLFILVGIAVGVIPMLMGRILGAHNPDAAKLSAYECGFAAFEDARIKFDVRYYLIAILFILFDLETALLFPWAVASKELGFEVFLVVMFFIAELALAFFYLWKRGALDWE